MSSEESFEMNRKPEQKKPLTVEEAVRGAAERFKTKDGRPLSVQGLFCKQAERAINAIPDLEMSTKAMVEGTVGDRKDVARKIIKLMEGHGVNVVFGGDELVAKVRSENKAATDFGPDNAMSWSKVDGENILYGYAPGIRLDILIHEFFTWKIKKDFGYKTNETMPYQELHEDSQIVVEGGQVSDTMTSAHLAEIAFIDYYESRTG